MAETPAGPRPAARRRFVPVPIETTAESYRQGRKNDISLPTPGSGQGPHHTIGPAGELTPSPSPLSASPPPPAPPPVSPPAAAAAAGLWTKRRGARHAPRKEKRHFAPQLIDFSRRSRRSGDVGPATKPTDKTDITPHQNHIYALRHRTKHRKVQSLARRESCDDETAAHVFETLAREAEARMLENAALAAFPNSRARAGGAEHFVLREGSEDDSYGSSRAATPGLASHDRKTTTTSGTAAAAATTATLPTQHAPRAVASLRRPTLRTAHRSRRDSSTEDVGWALRELQQHHEQLAKARAEQAAPAAAAAAAADEAVADDARMDGAAADRGEAVAAAAAARKTTTASTPVRSASATTTPARAVHTIADRISTLDLDRMSIESPPNDALWTTHAERRQTDDGIGGGRPAGDSSSMPFIPEEPTVFPSDAEAYQGIPAYALRLREAERRGTGAIEDSDDDDDDDLFPGVSGPSAAKGGGLEAAEAAAAAAETGGFRGRNAYAGYRNRDIFASEREVERLRKKSPPMLGAGLVFRQSASPQQTKLETDFLWHADDAAAAAAAGAATATATSAAAASRAQTQQQQQQQQQQQLERNRDASGTQGLWRGYCFTSREDQAVVPLARPSLLATPFPQGAAAAAGDDDDHDPFAQAFAQQPRSDPNAVYGEPASASEDEADEALTPAGPTVSVGLWSPPAAAAAPAPAKKTKGARGTIGLHPLQRAVSVSVSVSVAAAGDGSSESAAAVQQPPLASEKDTSAALEAKIAAEFTDRFVTQVFNYLSLGYPAMARDYDEELAKIAHMSVAELQQDDDAVEGSAKGHISLGDGLFDDHDDGGDGGAAPVAADAHNHASCPRWRALKLYILEWARQHPDLDGGRAQPWGVQERRGSWGV